jgi:hypothetical protein
MEAAQYWLRAHLHGMPFKHKAFRRQRIPPARYRVTNWPAYEAGLRRRGDLTLCWTRRALAEWSAPSAMDFFDTPSFHKTMDHHSGFYRLPQ